MSGLLEVPEHALKSLDRLERFLNLFTHYQAVVGIVRERLERGQHHGHFLKKAVAALSGTFLHDELEHVANVIVGFTDRPRADPEVVLHEVGVGRLPTADRLHQRVDLRVARHRCVCGTMRIAERIANALMLMGVRFSIAVFSTGNVYVLVDRELTQEQKHKLFSFGDGVTLDVETRVELDNLVIYR